MRAKMPPQASTQYILATSLKSKPVLWCTALSHIEIGAQHHRPAFLTLHGRTMGKTPSSFVGEIDTSTMNADDSKDLEEDAGNNIWAWLIP